MTESGDVSFYSQSTS
jgi:hypothetical protein